MASKNSLEAEIDRETDEQFWAETGLPRGYKISRHNAADAGLIDRWLEIRYGVAAAMGRALAAPLVAGMPFDRLQDLVAQHETFWSRIVELHPDSALMRWWMADKWSPFYVDWIDLLMHHHLSDADADTLADLARRLNGLRGEAQAHEIPLPDVGSGGTAISGDAMLGGTMQDPYIGAARGARFSERLVQVAQVLAPVRHVTLSTALAGHLLTVRACIDGACYEGTADLSTILAELGALAPAYHAKLHAEAGSPLSEPLVGAAADLEAPIAAIAGELIGQAQAEICAGWWHSLTHEVSNAVHGVEHAVSKGVNDVGHTLVQLKGPIEAAASVAAGAAALAIPGAGPFVAPLASSLTKNLIDAATGSGSVKQAAQQVVTQAQQQAQSNPQIAKALDVAHQTVAQTTAAYHVAATVANAAKGDPNAQAQVAELTTAAAQGDPAAQQAVATVQAAASDDAAAGDDDGGGDAATAVQGWPALALMGLGGFAAGRFGGQAIDWARGHWHHPRAA